MCCFSMPVEHVANTNIFVRDAGETFQYLVYSMDFMAEQEGAMILPLPVVLPAEEEDVRFLNLEGFAGFFDEMRWGFRSDPAPLLAPGQTKVAAESRPVLKVQSVGAFDVSFVPSLSDFDRLDPRFRIPQDVWDQVPGYDDYGFAVVKLRAQKRRMAGRLLGKKRSLALHPVGMKFPRRDTSQLFVPTVHIHDGQYHPSATFDHDIYCQSEAGETMWGFEESEGTASAFMDIPKTLGTVDGSRPCLRVRLRGKLRNKDVILPQRKPAEDAKRWRWWDLSGEFQKSVKEYAYDRVVRPNAAAIEDFRRRHPALRQLQSDGGRVLDEDLFSRLCSELEEPIREAREDYRLIRDGLVNVDEFFDRGLRKALVSVLERKE